MTRKSPSHKSGFEGAVCKLSGYVSKQGTGLSSTLTLVGIRWIYRITAFAQLFCVFRN